MQIVALVVTLLAAVQPRLPAPGTRIAVQPFDGSGGPALRSQVIRMLRARGVRVVTGLPAVTGTAQYPGLARDRHVAGFVVTSTEERRTRHIVTFMVWNGLTGSIAGEWTVSGPPKKLPKLVTKGFWKHLGRALAEVKAPPSTKMKPAPTIRIDAGSPLDQPLSEGEGSGLRTRRRAD